MRCLVTGGAGFIGSHLADALVQGGHEVTVLDDLSSGKEKNVPEAARLVVQDVRNPYAADLIRQERPEVVFHLAAQMDVRRSVADPRFDADVNIGGTLNLLEACAEAGTRRFVFASTGGAIYGEQESFPAPETHPTRPVSPYGCSKASAELYLCYYGAEHGLSWVALRFANVYGPRQDPHGEAGVVAIFCGRLLAGEPCTIYGDGKQTRDYVYVGDVVRANLLAMESAFVGPINVGTGVETDVNTLYATLAKIAGRDAAPEYAEGRPGEQRRSVVAIDRAREVLGWRPEVTLEEGLRTTYEWFAAQG
ncbi:MAG: SDR family oxidoreductase [Deltaproteobacteria bacterium]|nr:MAG: SDR family oxidoreductase [Deltaproteobacteria bacterium]